MSSLVKPIGIGLLISSNLLSGCIRYSGNSKNVVFPEDVHKAEIAAQDSNRPGFIDETKTFVYTDTLIGRYNHWVDSTLAESAKYGKNSILVNKLDYSLYLIKNGIIDSRYDIELGLNPFDDKEKLGDGCTPEGMYVIEKKRHEGDTQYPTQYHRALLIDYPTPEQTIAGKTGGYIEIHGSGSGIKPDDGGRNWTEGCMALSDNDIDNIFPYVNEGDRVTIVKYTTRDLY